MTTMLDVRDLHAYYGKSHILQGVSFDVKEGEIVSLLGRNGVGRSTTIKAIMGLVPPQGTVNYRGRNIAGMTPHEIAHQGLGYVPEDRSIFPTLTVRQNLLLGQKSTRKQGRWSVDDMYKLFPRLQERADTLVGDLLSEIARRGVSVLLVEQKLTIALRISQRLYVMGHGHIVYEGTPDALAKDEAVRKEWLEV